MTEQYGVNQERVATAAELEERAQREVAGLESVINLQVGALQGEVDRRFTSVQREHELMNVTTKDLIASSRDHSDQLVKNVETRLDGIDKATEVLNEIVTRVPTDVQQAVGNLRDVMDERFDSISTQFAERDTRSERESRDNKVAVDAAFAAQKEAAAKQDESNAKAIDKSEKATTETINKLNGLFDASNKGLSDKIDDIKSRIITVESIALGGQVQRNENRGQISTQVAVLMAVITIVGILVTALAVTHGFTR